MALSNDLISQFVKLTNDGQNRSGESTVYGTAEVITDSNGNVVSTRVILDGSTVKTPVETTSEVKNGERVTVLIKDHTAVITGNVSSPSARSVDEIHRVTTDELSVVDGFIQNLRALFASFNKLEVDELEAVNAKIESIYAKFAEVENLTVEDLKAVYAEIDSLRVNVGNFGKLSADELEAVDAEIQNLKVYTGKFTYLSTNVFDAIRANIRELYAKKLTADQADIKYANIDFANIGEAAVRKLFADSGLIKDLVVGDQSITGELVAVTVSADLIKANTLTVDKLIVRGVDEDGNTCYYSIGEDLSKKEGVTPVEADQIHGSNIVANSVTANKIRVEDLSAFGATIGSFVITDDTIHSEAKGTVNTTTPGVYQDRDGQFAVGNGDYYIKFYKDSKGEFNLDMKAKEIKLSTGKTVEEAVSEATDFEIGGRNLIRNSETMMFKTYRVENAPTTSAKLGKAVLGAMILGKEN